MKRNTNSNIVYTTKKELESLGYKESTPTYSIKKFEHTKTIDPPAPGCMLLLTNKGLDLWCELSAEDIKISKVNCISHLIMEKNN